MASCFHKQYIMVILSSVFFISSSQTVYTGSTFTSTTSYQYEDEIIKCNDNSDCSITCSYSKSCYNTTIFCPNSSNACSLTCTGTSACYYADIHWVPGSTNSLQCSSSACFRTPYPPSINDNTELTIYCDSSYLCYGTIITCPDNAECRVICSGDYHSCGEAIIHCPLNALCNVVCTGSYACQNAIVHWKSSGSSTFVCKDGGNQCNLINKPTTMNATNNEETYTFFCNEAKQCASATINCPSNGNCVVHCSESGACAGSIINCGDGDCNILCTASYACDFATIYGPTNKDFSIYCDDKSASCRGASIHAEDSSYFNLLSSSSSTSSYYFARNISIWFPPRKGDSKRAYILSNNKNFNGYYGYESQQFYAINGWLDIDIQSDGVWTYQGGTMHCGADYEYSCSFNNTSWSCDTSNTICDYPNVTTTSTTTTTPTTTTVTTLQPSATTKCDTAPAPEDYIGHDIALIVLIIILIILCLTGWGAATSRACRNFLKGLPCACGCCKDYDANQNEKTMALLNNDALSNDNDRL